MLHFVLAAHKDARPVVDVFWYDGEHTFHPTIDGLTAGYREKS